MVMIFSKEDIKHSPPLSSIQHIDKAYFWSNVVLCCSVCSLPPPLFQKNKNMFDKIFFVIMFFCHLLEFELRILGRPMEISMASLLFNFQYNDVFLKFYFLFCKTIIKAFIASHAHCIVTHSIELSLKSGD